MDKTVLKTDLLRVLLMSRTSTLLSSPLGTSSNIEFRFLVDASHKVFRKKTRPSITIRYAFAPIILHCTSKHHDAQYNIMNRDLSSAWLIRNNQSAYLITISQAYWMLSRLQATKRLNWLICLKYIKQIMRE